MSSRQPLDLDLDDFDTPPVRSVEKRPPAAARKAIDKTSAFPSREASVEGQLNIKAPEDAIERFRKLAKAERYKLGAFLEVLMDAYEAKSGRK